MAKKVETKETKKTAAVKDSKKVVVDKESKTDKKVKATDKKVVTKTAEKEEPKKTSIKNEIPKVEKKVIVKETPKVEKKVITKEIPKVEKKVAEKEIPKVDKKTTDKELTKELTKNDVKPVVKEKKVKAYSQKELEEFKKVILEKREEIIEQLQALKEQMMDPTTGQYVNENSPYSLHMAEQGTDSQEREKLYLWAQRENKFLGYLEDALKRIDNGTYGLCLDCIDEPKNLCPTCPLIPKERLIAVPHTQMCVQVKNQQNKK